MKLTPAKLRYLLTIAEMEKEEAPYGVRCIDLAIKMGVARASTCRMISIFIKEGLLRQCRCKTVNLTPEGQQLLESYREQYRKLCPLFSEQLGLSDFDAQECALALVSCLPEGTMQQLCAKISHL